MVTIQTGAGPITLPYMQVVGIGKCVKAIQQTGRDAVWHPAACGCCFIVHARTEPGELMHEGFVVGQDGGYDWHDHADEPH
jgi:hypothetical protein